ENIVDDEDIERQFVYEMPEEVRALFKNSETVEFDVKKAYNKAVNNGHKSKEVLEESIEQHAQMCKENSEDIFDARILAKELKDDIRDRVRRYSHCIIYNTKNYRNWLFEDYYRKLRLRLNEMFQDE